MADTDETVLENLKLMRDAILAAPDGQIVRLEIRGRMYEKTRQDLTEIMDLIDRFERKTATTNSPARNLARIKR